MYYLIWIFREGRLLESGIVERRLTALIGNTDITDAIVAHSSICLGCFNIFFEFAVFLALDNSSFLRTSSRNQYHFRKRYLISRMKPI